MIRRITAIVIALAVLFAGAAVVFSAAFEGDAAGTRFYQCVNARGQVEARRAGTSRPVCAHANDRILTWDVTPLAQLVAPTTAAPTTAPPVLLAPAPTTTTAAPTTTTTSPPVVVPPAPSWWQPGSTHSLQFWNQQSGVVGLHSGINVYETDWTTTTPVQVAAFHVSDAKAICQVNAGAFDPGRPDASQFPAAALGNPAFPAPPGFQWLDVRNTTIRGIIAARIQTCKQKGFDAADFTYVNGYANPSGFPLTAADQLNYNRWLATTAHSLGLAAGLNEDRAQIAALEPAFDFGAAIDAQFLGQAGDFATFVNANKAVFDTEILGIPAIFCPQDAFDRINGLKADFFLSGAGYSNCPSW